MSRAASPSAQSQTDVAAGRPIGVFDSGVGGLTVLAALMAALPHERFLYLGDTARVPYGSKPLAMVRGFAEQITAELLASDVKAVVIACNTASAASLPALAERCPVPVWGVVEPGVAAALAAAGAGARAEVGAEAQVGAGAGKRAGIGATIGVLGTDATIAARVYQDRLERAGALTWARACPLFVPLVEEGLQDSEIAALVVEHYLADRPPLTALILGCTHYPLLKPVLGRALGDDVKLVDSSEAVAAFVAAELEVRGLLRRPPLAGSDPVLEAGQRLEYLVTGDVDVFLHTASRLGGPVAPARHVDLKEVRHGIESPATRAVGLTVSPATGAARPAGSRLASPDAGAAATPAAPGSAEAA